MAHTFSTLFILRNIVQNSKNMSSKLRNCPCVFKTVIKNNLCEWNKQRLFYTYNVCSAKIVKKEEKPKKVKPDRSENTLALIQTEQWFDEVALQAKNKETYYAAVRKYIKKEELYRRGHCEFIQGAMRGNRMKEFGVHKDLKAYKLLLDVFPVGKFHPQSPWQAEFMHYPKQQDCAIDIMDEMNWHGVIPDEEFGEKLRAIFSDRTHAYRKYQRCMYWNTKMKHANPYKLPFHVPNDPIELAILALKRMAVDLENKITVWKTMEMEDSPSEDTFIASAQSPTQQKLLLKHPVETPLFVEGGHMIWLREQKLTYFILRGEPDLTIERKERAKKANEELFEWTTIFESENPTEIVPLLSPHEQDDGTIFGMCITGTSTKDSLVIWIRYLQRDNPSLEDIPIVFSLRTPAGELIETEVTHSSSVATSK